MAQPSGNLYIPPTTNPSSNPYSFSNFGKSLLGGISNQQKLTPAPVTPSAPQIGVSSPAKLQQAGLVNAPFNPASPNPNISDKANTGFAMNQALLANNNPPAKGIINGGIQGNTQALNNNQAATQVDTKNAATGTNTNPPTITQATNTGGNPGGNPYVAPLATFAQTGTPQVQQANENLTKLQNDFANQSANISGRAEPISEAIGEQGILQAKYGQQLSAAQTGVANALASQGQQQTGLAEAAGIAQPTPYGLGTSPYSSVSGYGSVAGTQANGGVAGIGALKEQINQGANAQDMSSTIGQTGALIKKTLGDINIAGFNPSPMALGNYLTGIINNKIAPDPSYANVQNDLTEVASTIAQILGNAGVQTDTKTIMAQELIPRLMSGQSIPDVLANLEQNANLKLQAVKNASQNNAITGGFQVGQTFSNGTLKWDGSRFVPNQ